MKTLTLLFVLILALPAFGQAGEAKKDFDVKAVFGVNLGDSKDSLKELVSEELPKYSKKEYRLALTKCGTILGFEIEEPKVYVLNGKVETLFGVVSREGELGIALEKDTKTLRSERNGTVSFLATYRNCTVLVFTPNNEEGYPYYVSIQAPTKPKKSKK